MDEVTPDQLSIAFLEDYMALPTRFFDYRQQAPQRYSRFLERRVVKVNNLRMFLIENAIVIFISSSGGALYLQF